MATEYHTDHLSRIETMWTIVAKAHSDQSSQIGAAQERIIERYSGAVYRYLLGVLRDADAADEVFQEFALRVLKGGFRNADQERGRFRDYVKTAVLRLVTDFHRKKKRKDPVVQAGPLDEAGVPADDDGDAAVNFDKNFLASCRDELLGRAWGALQVMEESSGQPYFSVLDYRARNPKTPSERMAVALTEQLQPDAPFSPPGIRKTLQRAREKFSELLLYEVTQMLGEHTPEELEAELIELGLQPYCQSAFDRRK